MSSLFRRPVITRRRLARLAVGLVFAWLVAWLGARFLIVRVPVEHADAIVVLSGSATMRERVSFAAKLYLEGKSDRIILTNDNLLGGWSNLHQRNLLSFERAMILLKEAGVAESAVTIVNQPVSGTHDEAVVVHQLCQANRLQSVLLVTSGYHSRRAYSTFLRELEGVLVGIEPVPPGFQTPKPAIWWLYPRGWLMVPLEYIKLVTYSVSY